MKTTKIATLLASLIVGSIVMSSGAFAGVAATKHNLGSTGTKTNKTDGTDEVCVFCHTPHGAQTTTGMPPLWNKTIPSTTYTTYDSLGTSSLDGGITEVGSVSIACLSCHDGSQAMDVMLNQPGSGANPGRLPGTWNAAVEATSGIMPTGIANLGGDLKNDHPIGIQYAGGGVKSGNLVGADPDFTVPKQKSVNGMDVWWVDTETIQGGSDNSSREKTDMQLYTRTVSGTYRNNGGSMAADGVPSPYVECASCHDPHSENTTFLRISNTGSKVCLSCHIK